MPQRWLSVLVMTGIAGIAAAGTATGQSAGTPGLRTTPISVPAGTIRVSLPDDMAAGDTISGTVVAEPAGRTEKERSANASVLEGYVVDAGPKKTSIRQRVLTWIVPAAATAVALVVRDSRGKEVARVSVPVRTEQPRLGPLPKPQDFRFPQIAVGGQPLSIHGPFSGDIANSALTIGGQPVELLAESPRTIIVAPAPNVSGPADYRLTESGVAVTAPCHVIGLKLSAPKTGLTRGERVAVHIAIDGLNGIREPVNLKLVNQTPTVVALAGGALQVLTIRPGDITPAGTYATDREVTGLGNGAFSIQASLDDRNPPTSVNGTSAPNPMPSTKR
jgi:hypothetical protein